MYLLDEKTTLQLETIYHHINNTYDLGMYLDNVYVSEPITSILDEECLRDKLSLVNECLKTIEKIYKDHINIRYVRRQLVIFKDELDIIKGNIATILRKKAIEGIFDLMFDISDISWDDFELLCTEYYNDVLDIENVSYNKLLEMYEVILGVPHMTLKEFLNHCTACGGDWVSMLLSGIEECYPNEYVRLKTECDKLQSNSGASEFIHICDFLSTVITDWKGLEE